MDRSFLKPLFVGLCLAVFSLQATWSQVTKSPTYDEVIWAGLGYYSLTNQKWDIEGALLQPPLSRILQSLPFFFVRVPPEVWQLPSGELRGQALLELLPGDQIIHFARLPNLVIVLLLGVCISLWAKELFGWQAGVLGLLLFTFEPNLLAFTGIANPDIVLAACLTFSAYAFYHYLRSPSRPTFIFAGITLGLAMASKFTALTLIPLYAIILLLAWLWRGEFASKLGNHHASLWRQIWRLAGLVGIALFVVWSLYLFDVGYLVRPDSPTYRLLDSGLSSSPALHDPVLWLTTHLPIPLAAYTKGVIFQLGASRLWPYDAFLAGAYSSNGFWDYFLVAYMLKTPIPFLLLFPIALFWYWQNRGSLSKASLLAEACLLFPAIFLLLYMSVANRIQFGLRYILPVIPLLIIWVSRAAAVSARYIAEHLHHYRQDRAPIQILAIFPPILAGCLLFIWLVAGTLRSFPNYLAYFNESIGGPQNGYRYLVDSNLDWGQDLKGLATYMQQNGIQNIQLSYFGAMNPLYYGIDYTYLPSALAEEGITNLKTVAPRRQEHLPTNGLIAISATELQGLYFKDKTIYNWLKAYHPVAQIGYSIFVYDVP